MRDSTVRLCDGLCYSGTKAPHGLPATRGGSAGGARRRGPTLGWCGMDDVQVAAAADVGVGDAAELGGELFPGAGDVAIRIVRTGGCVIQESVVMGLTARVSKCRGIAERCIICPKLQVT